MAATPDLIAAEPMGPGSQHHPGNASGPAIGQLAAVRARRRGVRWGKRQ